MSFRRTRWTGSAPGHVRDGRSERRASWCAIGLVAMAAACGRGEALGPGDPSDNTIPARDGSPVQTDSLVYTLSHEAGTYDAYAVALYVNRGLDPMAFARCRPEDTTPTYAIVRSEPASTPWFVGGAWGCVGVVPAGFVAPGESLRVRVWLGGTESPGANPPITMAERTGRFRILLDLCAAPAADSDDCPRQAPERRRSNAFRILPPR